MKGYLFYSNNADKSKKSQNEDPEKAFLKNVLTMVHGVMKKMSANEESGAEKRRLDSIAAKAQSILDEMKTKGKIPKEAMKALRDSFNEYFASSFANKDKKLNKTEEGNKKKRAPHCKLGQDCFDDVDHKDVDREIKHLAVILIEYLKERIVEEDAHSSTTVNRGFPDAQRVVSRGNPSYHESHAGPTRFRMDDLFTRITVVLSKLHRATMRNWNEIQLIVDNMSGNRNVEMKVRH